MKDSKLERYLRRKLTEALKRACMYQERVDKAEKMMPPERFGIGAKVALARELGQVTAYQAALQYAQRANQ